MDRSVGGCGALSRKIQAQADSHLIIAPIKQINRSLISGSQCLCAKGQLDGASCTENREGLLALRGVCWQAAIGVGSLVRYERSRLQFVYGPSSAPLSPPAHLLRLLFLLPMPARLWPLTRNLARLLNGTGNSTTAAGSALV